MSGILQQGYSFGYVLAACTNLGVGGSTESFKIVFWVGAALSFAVGLVRCFFPESQQFIEARKAGNLSRAPSHFWRETRSMLANEWKLSIYCIILMTWFNYYSHSSQDSCKSLSTKALTSDHHAHAQSQIRRLCSHRKSWTMPALAVHPSS